ncbi:hypothetical protein E3P86_01501 [Wallemia ichthyophaga]|uniref:PXA domain-containing protein n=1 Tax=Wallemia ichthyophaga TaxID=245174 RepID=A0A4T0JAJ2_WALIC|nr:hypothetical protein E3P86_01501 [Wallemia ichthyophaga]
MNPADGLIDKILNTNHLPSRTAFMIAVGVLLLYLQWQAILVVLLAGFLATSDHFTFTVKTLLQDDSGPPINPIDNLNDSRNISLKSLAPISSLGDSDLHRQSTYTDKLDVLPELYEPLDSTLDLIVRDFVNWWYIPLALNPPDLAFPRECRRSLNHLTSSICQRVVAGRSGSDIAIFIFCSTAQTLLRGLRTRRMPSQNSGSTVEPKENQDYHPLLRSTAAQILALSSAPADAENGALQSLLTEIIAGQIEAAVSILTPDWVNLTVIALFEDEKKEQRVREEAERMRVKVEQVVNSDTVPGEYKEDDECGDNEHKHEHENMHGNEITIPDNHDNDNTKRNQQTNKTRQQRPRRETHHGQRPSISTSILEKEGPLPVDEEDLGATASEKKTRVVSPFTKPTHEANGDIGVKEEEDKVGVKRDATPTLREILAQRNNSELYDDFERFLEMRRREGLLRLLTQVTTFKEIVTITSPSEPIFRQDAIALLARAEEAVVPGDVRLLESINATRMKIDGDASLNAFLPIEVEIYTNLENEYGTFTMIKRDGESIPSGSVPSVPSVPSTNSEKESSEVNTPRTSGTSTTSMEVQPKEFEPSYYQRHTKVDVTDVSTPSPRDFVNGKTLEVMVAIEEEGESGWMLFRRWVEFEKLDGALQKAFPMAGTASFPRAYLPTLKHKRSSDVCALLAAYIKTLLIDPRYSRSVIVTDFLRKEQTGAGGKNGTSASGGTGNGRNSKLFNLTQPGKTFSEFAQAVSDIGVNKKRLSFPGPLGGKGGRGPAVSTAPPTPPKEVAEVTDASDVASNDTINEVDMRTPAEEVDHSAYATVGSESKSSEEEEEEESVGSESEGAPSATVAYEEDDDDTANNTTTTQPTTTPPMNDEDLNLVLNSIFSILEEAYELSGQQWSLRRGFFRVLERVIRTSYSSTVRTALQSIVEGVTNVRNVAQVLNSLKDALWPPPMREWGVGVDESRSDEEKVQTAQTARQLLIDNKPSALSSAMGDSATRDAMILLHELFQDEKFCQEVGTLLALDLLPAANTNSGSGSTTAVKPPQPSQPRSAVNTTQERGNPVTELPEQADNRATKWSPRQRSKEDAFVGARFEQKNLGLQPNPKAAIELIADEPVRLVEGRVANCDGGGGPLGHPKIYIKLDKPGAHACGYCGIRFEQALHDHGH